MRQGIEFQRLFEESHELYSQDLIRSRLKLKWICVKGTKLNATIAKCILRIQYSSGATAWLYLLHTPLNIEIKILFAPCCETRAIGRTIPSTPALSYRLRPRENCSGLMKNEWVLFSFEEGREEEKIDNGLFGNECH